jgi:hypothetical protein
MTNQEDDNAQAAESMTPAKLPPDLRDLAERINVEHQQAEAALNHGVEHALAAGRMLVEAKAQIPHGEWLPWLAQNFEGSQRTARTYMLVANRWPALEANRQRAANLSIRQAAALTTRPHRDRITDEKLDPAKESPQRFLQYPVEDRREYCQQWWDGFARYTLTLDAAKWTPLKIAETLGMPISDVDAVLNPRPPQNDFTSFRDFTGFHDILALAQRYGDAVAAGVAFHLRWAYWSAQHKAEEEGLSEVIPTLQALEAKQQRLRASLDGDEHALAEEIELLATTAVDKWTWPVAFLCCITDDVREALGIAPQSFPGRVFLFRFQEWCKVCKNSAREQEASRR